jgi:hypothetical protein
VNENKKGNIQVILRLHDQNKANWSEWTPAWDDIPCSSSGSIGEYMKFETPLLICKIRSFHGGDYEEWCLLGCYDVWLL